MSKLLAGVYSDPPQWFGRVLSEDEILAIYHSSGIYRPVIKQEGVGVAVPSCK